MKNNTAKTTVVFCVGLLVVLMVIAIGTHAKAASASEITRFPADRYFVSVSDKTNTAATERMRHESEKARASEVSAAIAGFKEAERAAAEQDEAEPAYINVSDYSEPAYGYMKPSYDYAPIDGLTREGGVNYYDGRIETYYSSNALYHHRTPEWTLDDEGFYRDSEGRYVVAASDMEQGETFTGSKGECIVLDTGCAAGVTDYYVGW
ncbi:MAG: hypothetical protein IJ087_10385 [Eggerthellaceae bacterium]|nr:hypothetical protein [Eggerthellaceae bacterium]